MEYASAFTERHAVCTKKSLMQVHHSTAVVAGRAMVNFFDLPGRPSYSEFNWKVISLALSGKSVDVSKIIAMIDEVLTVPMAEHDEDDCDKAHCSKNFDQRGRDKCWLVTCGR